MTQPNNDAKPIDLSSFERVTLRLEEALLAHKNEPENLFILDSVIKRFELTYELTFKSIRRFLLDYAASKVEVDALTFQEMIRRGDELGLVTSNWQQWKEFRDSRNETIHGYHEEKAREIAKEAAVFLVEAQHVLANLKKRIANHG